MKYLASLTVVALLAACVPPEIASEPTEPPVPAVPIFSQSSDPLDVNLGPPPQILCDASLPRGEEVADCIRAVEPEGTTPSTAPVLLPGMILATPQSAA